MASINSVIDLSYLCKRHDIKMNIDESGIVLSANGISKHYDLEAINIISLDCSLQIIIDMFIEEHVLQFKKAIC